MEETLMVYEGTGVYIQGFDWNKRRALRLVLRNNLCEVESCDRHVGSIGPTMQAFCYDHPWEAEEALTLANEIWEANGTRCEVGVFTVGPLGQWKFGETKPDE